MSQDIIADAGYLFIATRMKRLADAHRLYQRENRST